MVYGNCRRHQAEAATSGGISNLVTSSLNSASRFLPLHIYGEGVRWVFGAELSVMACWHLPETHGRTTTHSHNSSASPFFTAPSPAATTFSAVASSPPSLFINSSKSLFAAATFPFISRSIPRATSKCCDVNVGFATRELLGEGIAVRVAIRAC